MVERGDIPFMRVAKDVGRAALKHKCPACNKGDLFTSKWSLETVAKCSECGFDVSQHDSGDGPAVFLSFVLGFSIIPLILWIAMITDWPLWLHGIIWSPLIIILSIGLLKPSKAATIILQHLYRPKDWE